MRMILRVTEALYKMNSNPNNDMIAFQRSGLIAGLALATKDPDLARRLDREMRTDWIVDDTVTGPYGGDGMADALIKELGGRQVVEGGF